MGKRLSKRMADCKNEVNSVDENKYKDLFNKITKKKSGKEQDLEIIEKRLRHLRKNGALSYEDLIKIKDEYAWPFNEYWMWPSREQIETKLRKTGDGLKIYLRMKRKS